MHATRKADDKAGTNSTLMMSEPLIYMGIKNRQRIQFIYHNKIRVTEPQCYGVSHAEKEIVRLFLIKGGTRPEQLFDVSKITDLHLLNEYFTSPGPNYKKDDSAMKIIFCQL